MGRTVAERARAKVNLALHVLGRRDDGYHELDSIVAFADLGDDLLISEASRFEIVAAGPFAAQLPAVENNILHRAWKGLAERHAGLPPVRVELVKNLPVAAGIGGGSADAAAMLRGLVRLFGLEVPDLHSLAMTLGADVPVCLAQLACRMQGAGERVVPIEDFAPRPALLVNPRREVPTAAVFARLGLEHGARFGTPVKSLDDPAAWRNDLEAPAIALVPAIAEVLGALRRQSGVSHAFMSGSGATCVGLVTAAPGEIDLPPSWWVAPVRLQ